MKKVAFITLIAALVFGINTNNTLAVTPTDILIDQVGQTGASSVTAFFDEDSQILSVRISAIEHSERVAVYLTSSTGKNVFVDKIFVGDRGFQLDIPMHEYEAGMYSLRLRGNTIIFSGRYEKK